MNEDVPRFTITLTHYHWSCGDGCCSDSGYKIHVTDGNKCILDNYEWEYNGNRDSTLDNGKQAIRDVLGRIPVEDADYTLVEEYEDSDDGREDQY